MNRFHGGVWHSAADWKGLSLGADYDGERSAGAPRSGCVLVVRHRCEPAYFPPRASPSRHVANLVRSSPTSPAICGSTARSRRFVRWRHLEQLSAIRPERFVGHRAHSPHSAACASLRALEWSSSSGKCGGKTQADLARPCRIRPSPASSSDGSSCRTGTRNPRTPITFTGRIGIAADVVLAVDRLHGAGPTRAASAPPPAAAGPASLQRLDDHFGMGSSM